MEAFIEHIIQFIVDQGALGVFLASVLEEIVVPIPSSIIQTGAGVLFLSGMPIDAHSIWILISRVVLPSALGTTLGSLVVYGLVYWGGMPFVKRFGRYFFITPSKVEHARDLVLKRKSLLWAFCVLRFIPILPSVFIAAGAGFIRLPLKTYIWTTFLGMFIRAIYLGAAGWAAGEAYRAAMPSHSVFGLLLSMGLGIFAVTAVIALIIFYARKKRTA